ncbi:hypothetical protein D6C83_09023 [Aureobasidium pullulans]|uniref:Uncharacterized protein n=1 Tax=Aureobasidium pullulans TaxID=5580 RepID=A0A4S9Z8Z0_AURPU|nr:hypothetical protein D6C83_09023 [Aureobasidium pullulans]
MSSTTCKAAEKETSKKAFEQRLEAYLEARKEYHRLYDQKHKKAILEEKKKRIDENPDLFRKRTKQYYQNHKEELCAYQKVCRVTITETQQAAYLARREARREARTQELSEGNRRRRLNKPEKTLEPRNAPRDWLREKLEQKSELKGDWPRKKLELKGNWPRKKLEQKSELKGDSSARKRLIDA